jgi:hypothetical protein
MTIMTKKKIKTEEPAAQPVPEDVEKIIAELEQKVADEEQAQKEQEPVKEAVEPKKKPRVRVKVSEPVVIKNKPSANFTAEQLNQLVYAGAEGIVIILQKEDMKPDETMMFSQTLYEIGTANGWFDKLDFLPYLILLGAGIDLSIKIAQKPSKKKPVQQDKAIVEKIENKEVSSVDPKFDIVDNDKLMKKLGGGGLAELFDLNET